MESSMETMGNSQKQQSQNIRNKQGHYSQMEYVVQSPANTYKKTHNHHKQRTRNTQSSQTQNSAPVVEEIVLDKSQLIIVRPIASNNAYAGSESPGTLRKQSDNTLEQQQQEQDTRASKQQYRE